MAGVVEQNTRAYQGIVDTVGERARESHASVEMVRQTAGSLQQALQSVAAFQASAERTAAGVQGTLQALQSGGNTAAARMEAVAQSMERAKPAIGEIERLLQTVHDRLAGADQHAASAWSEAARQVNDQLGEMVREIQSEGGRRDAGAGPVVPGRDPEVAGLLKRVVSTLESQRGPSPRAIAVAQGAGTLAALAAAYGVYLAARFLLPLLGV
jgi:ABC-type transporter Mla subunit MlaD